MKNIKYIVLLMSSIFCFMQCTPKVSDAVTEMKEEMKEEVMKPKTFRSAPPEPGPAPKIQLGTYETFKASNNLEVIVVENHKIPRVSFQLYVDKPLIAEGESAGFKDMAGELLKTGTTSKSKAEIDEAVDFMGATLRTNRNGMFGSSLRKHTDKLLDIMADVLVNPSFPQKQFDRIKKQTLSAMASEKEDPNAIARNVANTLRFGKDHPYGEITTEKSVEKITLQQCKDYYKNNFNPDNAYLVVVGDITPAEAKSMVDKFFGKWKKGGQPKMEKFAMPKAPESTQVDFVNKTGAVQSVVAVTYPMDIKPGSVDEIPSSVMNTMLGGFFRSYLNNNLREDKGYTYGSRSSLNTDKEIGYFTAGASVRNEVTDSSVVEIMKELNNIRNIKISDENLSLVKNVMSGNFARSLERPETVARFALNTARYNLSKDYYETYLEKLSNVTAADVQAMAKKYIKPDNAHIIVVGNKDEVAEKLIPFAASGKVNYFDVTGTEIKMDEAPIPTDLTAVIVIQNYLDAIGGKEKLMAIKDIKTTMGTEMQGMQLTSTVFQKAPNLFSNEIAVAGMGVVQKQVFNGEKGAMSAMGKNEPMGEDQVVAMKAQTTLISEIDYLSDKYKLELKGTEPVDGVSAYKILVTTPDGKTKTEFYDTKTALKLQETQTSEVQGNKVTQTTTYSDYKAVDGIMFPYTMIISGAMPAPMKMEVTEIKVNGGLEDSVFKVD